MSSAHRSSLSNHASQSQRSSDPALASAVPTYVIVPCQAPIDASEVETDAKAIELSIRWADSLLEVIHLAAKRTFTVGDGTATQDFVVPADALGATSFELVSADGTIRFPANATGEIRVASGETVDRDGAVAAGLAQRQADGSVTILAGSCPLVTVEIGNLRFSFASVAAGKRVAGASTPDKRAFGFHGLSLGLHAAFIVAAFALMPALNADDATEITNDQRYELMQTLAAQAEKDAEEEKALEEIKPGKADERGEGSKGEEGKLGDVNSKATNKHFSIAGKDQERMLGKEQAIADAQKFGMIGLISTLDGSDPNTPIAPWGDIAQGNDAANHLGNFWGEEAGNAFGFGGLGLTGVGEGGGRRGEGIGVGDIGGLGTCVSAGCGGGSLGAFSSARLSPRHQVAGVRMRSAGDTKVGGRLPPEVIQRVIRQNFGRMRACYEPALRTNPNLQGRVAVKFVIGRDGSVGTASNGGSDLPDSGVVSCVVRAFYGISFPQPENGIVTVTYPIMFSPAG